MNKEELLKEYEDNGILIKEIGLTTYNLIFDKRYARNIYYNLNTFGQDYILGNAKNRALMGGYITNFIDEPYVDILHSSPYEFQVNGPFSVAIFFAQRIIVQ